ARASSSSRRSASRTRAPASRIAQGAMLGRVRRSVVRARRASRTRGRGGRNPRRGAKFALRAGNASRTSVHATKACVGSADHRAIRTGKLATLHIASESRADGVRSPLNRLARAATQACAPEELIGALEDAFAELLGTTEFHVVAVTQDNTGAHGESVALRTGGEDYVRFEGPSGMARVVATGRPFAVPDLHGSPDVSRRLVSPSSSVSALFLPIAWNDAVRRVSLIGWHTPNPIDQDTIDLAELLCETAASGFSRIEEAERRAAGAEQDKAVVRAGRALNEPLDLDDVLN